MKALIAKFFVLFSILFSLYSFTNILFENHMKPLWEYISALSLSDKKYLRTEQYFEISQDSMLFENSQLRLHKKNHKDESEVFDCENSVDSGCYVSSEVIDATSENAFLSKCLLNGHLPKNSEQIAINEKFAKRLNLDIGDKIIAKSSLFFNFVEVVGIIRNLNGFSDYSPKFKYYTVINRGAAHISLVRGNAFRFSNSEAEAFFSESIIQKLKPLKKMLGSYFLIVFVLLAFFQTGAYEFHKRLLTLPSYYRHMQQLGKNLKFIQKRKNIDALIFISICFTLILISSIFGDGIFMLLFDTFSLIVSTFVIFLLGRLKWQFWNSKMKILFLRAAKKLHCCEI